MASKSDKLSVVMAVYKNDNPKWVAEAIDSILNQTYKADEIVVVIDGPISKSIQNTLDSYGKKLTKIQLPKNKGLWNALNVGIEDAKHSLIARMDSDDIAKKDRFEKQIKVFRSDPDLAVLGGQLIEFSETVSNTGTQRKVPESHVEIVKFARFRSPLNHPTVMFRKEKVQQVGGYHEFYRTEDYDLWVRMIQAGMKMKNLPDTLLHYRLNKANVNRKTTFTQHRESIKLQKRLRREGFLSFGDYITARAARSMFYYMPNQLKYLAYRKLLRSNSETDA
jgi:glycosyltransferase involved in cell wall biosynthesis